MLIYEPKGKAREYSPLALNVYTGCDHGCKYCYVPAASRGICKNTEISIRPKYFDQLHKDLAKDPPRNQILLSFLTDPYNNQEPKYHYTRRTLMLLNDAGCCVSVLTKGAERAIQDMNYFLRFGPRIQVGCSLTSLDPARSRETEPNASLPADRLELLRACHDAGIKTWCSIEPVIDPAESLAVMEAGLPFIDLYKIGKLNHDAEAEARIDWPKFLKAAVSLMKKNGKNFYVKDDLAMFAFPAGIKFLPENRIADHWAVRAQKPDSASPAPSGELFA